MSARWRRDWRTGIGSRARPAPVGWILSRRWLSQSGSAAIQWRCYNLAREDHDMKRLDFCAVLGFASVALLIPAGMQAKEETITLEITGMS